MDIVRAQKRRRPIKLRRIFIRYLTAACALVILLIVLLVCSFMALLSQGVILPANYTANQLSAARGAIESGDTVTPDMIPELCRYAVYTAEGKIISGNLSSVEAKKAWGLTQNNTGTQDFIYFYLKITRKGEFCIVRFTYLAQFAYPVLRKYLPPPEILAYLIFIFAFLSEIFLLASSFGKLLTRKMSGMRNATEKIRNKDLEFTVESSGILEIDDVLFSIDNMKEALKVSLRNQWNLEQERREQISALAHDVKTPLTVVRGNAELLAETGLTEEQKQYTGYITENALRMEQYLKALIKMSQTESVTAFRSVKIDSGEYLERICRQISALGSAKGLTADCFIGRLPPTFFADPDLLQRAIMNVISNAAECSREKGKIRFSAESEEGRMRFIITDSGKGFTQEELHRATEQFYMGDTSRSSKDHYGMGLYITKSIAELHKGALRIDNNPDTGGGQVTIEIPVNS